MTDYLTLVEVLRMNSDGSINISLGVAKPRAKFGYGNKFRN